MRSRTSNVLAPRGTQLRGWQEILLADPCAYCGREPETLDHITARRHGGGDEWDNFTPTCRPCNSGKGTRSLLSFLGGTATRPAYDAIIEQRSRWARVGVA